jgi:hypothetical protein
MLASLRQSVAVTGRRSLSTASASPKKQLPLFYDPKLVDRREGERGTGGRGSNAGVKVALFGASGVLGNYVCGELGTCGRIEEDVPTILGSRRTSECSKESCRCRLLCSLI